MKWLKIFGIIMLELPKSIAFTTHRLLSFGLDTPAAGRAVAGGLQIAGAALCRVPMVGRKSVRVDAQHQ